MFGALKSAFKALKDKIVKPVDLVEDKTQPTRQSDSQNSTAISKLGSVNEIKEDITEVIKQPPIDISVVDNNVEELISEKQDLVKNEPLAEILIEQESNLPGLKKEDKIIVEEKKEQKISTLTKIKSVFSSKYYLSESDLNAVSENLEMSFLQADLSIDVSEKLIDNLITKIKKEGLPKEDSLDLSVKEVFIDVINSLITKKYNESFFTNQDKKPYVIMFVGTNGTGKTTSIAKLAHYLKSKGKKIVLSASDTYRAASIEQLSGHAEKIGVDIVKGKYGQDPASVAFDAIAFCKI
jgi:fused signal recognition particle receptor